MTNISNALKVAEQKSIMKFQWKHQDKQTQNSKLPDQNGDFPRRCSMPDSHTSAPAPKTAVPN